MKTLIKFCGITCQQDLKYAIQCQVDFIGFVLVPQSPRYIPPHKAQQLANQLPASIGSVAVCQHLTPHDLQGIINEFSPTYLQTEHADFNDLKLPPHCCPIHVFRNTLPPQLPSNQPIPSVLLEGEHSGQGQQCNTTLAIEAAARQPLLLAGGLTPDNVQHHLKTVQPAGVDVSSGIEIQPGIKCSVKMKQFADAVRLYDSNAMTESQPS